MRTLMYLLVAILLAGLLWQAWHPPVPESREEIRLSLPEHARGSVRWRVVTRRVISEATANDMEALFREAGLRPRKMTRYEVIILHTFRDKRTFMTRRRAIEAKNAWAQRGMKPDIVEKKGRFFLSLGRTATAEEAGWLRSRLRSATMPFIYEKQRLVLPVYRFVFPPMPAAAAKKLWKRVADMGFAEPVLMPDGQFRALYKEAGNVPTDSSMRFLQGRGVHPAVRSIPAATGRGKGEMARLCESSPAMAWRSEHKCSSGNSGPGFRPCVA